WSRDKIGPICRIAQDCAIVFEAIRGHDDRDAKTVAGAFNYNQKIEAKNLRVAYLKSDFGGDYPFKAQDSLALAKLRKLGIAPIAIELPEVPDIGFVLSAEAAAAFDELTRSGKDDLLVRQIQNAWPNVFRQARFIPAVEYIQANRLRTRLIEETHRALREFDVFLAPSWAGDNLLRTNLTGHPCVSLPNGFIDGLPTSITFCGQLFGEADVLKLAALYQANTDFHRKHPEGL
ncbi:MAG: amidase, partial [Phaeodactylibacter sp.]|nr:amidase [Phaeodactylibacter sp.]